MLDTQNKCQYIPRLFSLKIYFIFLSLLFLSFISVGMEPAPSPIFKFTPKAGDAYWAYNSKYPKQKILFVPTTHDFNLRFIRKDLIREIMKGDVLIIEMREALVPIDDNSKVLSAFEYTLNDYRKVGLIQNHAFTVKQPKYNPLSGKNEDVGLPWTDIIDDKDLIQKIEKLASPFLGQTPLENVNPVVILEFLNTMSQIKENKFGMDSKLAKIYSLSGKKIEYLETSLDATSLISGRKKYSNRLESLVDDSIQPMPPSTLRYTLITIAKAFFGKEETPKDKHKEDMHRQEQLSTQNMEFDYQYTLLKVANRNHLWIPKLQDYFKAYPDKFIVVAVGGLHFIGKDGILDLLSALNDRSNTFTFDYFGKEPQDSEPPAMPYGANKDPIKDTEYSKIDAEAEVANSIVNSLLTSNISLPEIIEYIKDEPHTAFSIKAELINVMMRLLKDNPTLQDPKNQAEAEALLIAYINVRNTIFRDDDVQDKKKAREILERRPHLTLQGVKEAMINR